MFIFTKKLRILTSILLLASFLLPVFHLNSQEYDPDFNKNEIISQFQMFDYNSMTQSEIQSFLRGKNSYLANYYTDGYIESCGTETKDCSMINMPASQIIYSAAQRYRVNPKYILVMLQKEQGLIQWDGTPPDKRLDWATGYAVCDGCSLSDPKVVKYKGFGKQVDNAAGAMKFYSDNALKYEFIRKATVSYTIDGQKVIPKNQATANLYTYTPHIRGNYTFWRVWQRYFGDPLSTIRDKAASISTDYMLQIIASSGEEINVNEGERTSMWVEYLNIGKKTWFNDDEQSLYLVDDKYRASIPIISKNSSLVSDDEIKNAVAVYSKRKSVKPGEVLRLTIPIEPNYEKYESGDYILVLEGKGWFADSDIGFDLTRTFRYDADLKLGIPSSLEARKTNTITVEYENIGLMPWYNYDVKLKWISSEYENYTKMNQWRVLPGETASFTFYSTVKEVGEHEYDLSLWKQINSWKMNKFPTGDAKFNTNMTVKYAAKLIYESIPEEMKAGSEKYVIIKVKNVGTEEWDDNLVLRSYSNISPFSSSYFRHSSWISGMAIAKVKRTVMPRRIYTFKFKIKAPNYTYSYDQYYQLEWGPRFEEIYIDKDLTKHFVTKVIK